MVSKLSSAHVYLRQPASQPHGEWDKLPPLLVSDAAQLVKANSIEGEQCDSAALAGQTLVFLLTVSIAGNKKDNITVRHEISALPPNERDARSSILLSPTSKYARRCISDLKAAESCVENRGYGCRPGGFPF